MAVVTIQDLSYSYGGSPARRSLDSCTLCVEAGEMVLVVGESGCGKSTLLRAINGLVPHFYGGSISGSVQVAGVDAHALGPSGLAHLVACVFQDPEAQMVASTVFAEVALGAENLGVDPDAIGQRVHEALGVMGIAHLVERSTSDLSGGEMQRVAIASALAMRPSVLLLDEPTSQLDPSVAESLLELLRRVNEDFGIAVVMAEHRLDRCFHWADRVVIMQEGRIVSVGTPRQSAAWSAEHGGLFVPPVTRLFTGLVTEDLPLNVKQGRGIVNSLRSTEATKRTSETAPLKSGTRDDASAGIASLQVQASDVPAAQIKALRHTYDSGTEALRGCDVRFDRGECVAIMGHNGAGKSTLVRHLIGLTRPQRGQVTVAGRDISTEPVESIARDVGFLGQSPGDSLFCDTVAEELEFSLLHLRPHMNDDERAEAVDSTLRRLGIAALSCREPRSLSVGQRQRVAVAAMAVADPAVLVLDEPTRGLDWESKKALGSFLVDLAARGSAVVVVTHDVEFAAEYANRAVVMGAGRILADGPTSRVLGESLLLAPQVTRVLGGVASGVVTIAEGRRVLGAVVAGE